MDTRKTIMDLARKAVQAHGYGGLSFRELAKQVGIKSASIHYHFATKGDLGAALARNYCEMAATDLAQVRADNATSAARIAAYAAIFRRALTDGNRMCLCGMLAAERENLPPVVQVEVEAFAALNIAWLAEVLIDAEPKFAPAAAQARAKAIYAAISGAQLVAHGLGNPAEYDAIVGTYQASGLIPT